MVFVASHLRQRRYLTPHFLLLLPAPPQIILIISSFSSARHHLPHPHQQLLVDQPSSWHGSWPFRNVTCCIYTLMWQFRIQ
jgi:hypothetical protein